MTQHRFIGPMTQHCFIGPMTQHSFIGLMTQPSFIGPMTQHCFIGHVTQHSFIGPTTQYSFIGPMTQHCFIGPTTQHCFIGPTTQHHFIGHTTWHCFIGSMTQHSFIDPMNRPSFIEPKTQSSFIGPITLPCFIDPMTHIPGNVKTFVYQFQYHLEALQRTLVYPFYHFEYQHFQFPEEKTMSILVINLYDVDLLIVHILLKLRRYITRRHDFACYWRLLPFYGLLKSQHIFLFILIALFRPMYIFFYKPSNFLYKESCISHEIINAMYSFQKIAYISIYDNPKPIYVLREVGH